VESYKLTIKRSAAKELEALPSVPLRRRAVAIIHGLADDPGPQGSIKLAGSTDAYRIRFGRYRILYSVSDRVRVVSIERIAHRKEAYR
jgi:mRNA interferase RelE/StbE